VFGHSGSQAPQLMHSLVIIVAMGRHEYHRPDGAFKQAGRARAVGFSSLAVAGEAPRCYGRVMRAVALAVLLTMAWARASRADDHADMRAALREVETARRHLEAAKHDYRGHRTTAVQELRQAEDEIKKGIAGAKPEAEKE